MVSEELRARRDKIVREHAESENRHDFDFALDTFHHPRYELYPTGDVIDGAEAVAAYYQETRAAFPDQRNRVIAIHHGDDAVVMELELTGTHLGSFRGPAADRPLVHLPHGGDLRLRGGPPGRRARLLRSGHDHAPARRGP